MQFKGEDPTIHVESSCITSRLSTKRNNLQYITYLLSDITIGYNIESILWSLQI